MVQIYRRDHVDYPDPDWRLARDWKLAIKAEHDAARRAAERLMDAMEARSTL